MKKHYTIILMFVLVFTGINKSKAQLSGELYVQTSYSMWLSNSKDLASFFKTYNGYVGGITKPFETKIGPMNGYNIAIGTRFGGSGKFYADIALTKGKFSSTTNTAEFDSGDRREIKMTASDWGCDFAMGGGRKFAIGFLTNLSFQKSYFNAAYRYANGTLSYGNEYPFNGVYDSFRLNIFYGLQLDFRVIKYLRLGVSAGRLTTMLPVDKMTFQDLSLIKNGSTKDYVPIDYAAYQNGASFDGNTAANDLRGWRINFNVRFQIPYGDYND